MSWRKEWLPTPVFLPGKSHGQRNLATVHGVTRVRHDLVTKSPLNSLVTSWLSKRTDLKPPFPAPYGLVYSDLQLISLQYHHSHAHAALQPHWTSLISLVVLYLSFLCDHWKIFFFYSARNPYPSIILPWVPGHLLLNLRCFCLVAKLCPTPMQPLGL